MPFHEWLQIQSASSSFVRLCPKRPWLCVIPWIGNLIQQKSHIFSKVSYVVNLAVVICRLYQLLTFMKLVTYLHIRILTVMRSQRCFLFWPCLIRRHFLIFYFPHHSSALPVFLFAFALYTSNAECLVRLKVLHWVNVFSAVYKQKCRQLSSLRVCWRVYISFTNWIHNIKLYCLFYH
jgi:hypothetical protein